MRAFACPVYRSFAPFEAARCATCGAALGLHLPSKSMVALDDQQSATVDGRH